MEQNSPGQVFDKTHNYYRTFDAKDRNSMTAICQRVNTSSLVLDLGAGCGAIGEYLATEKNCTVDGIDLHLEQTQQTNHYRTIHSANLETEPLSKRLSDQYDTIICADLIEHLRNPQQLLVQLKDYLKPDGRLLLSVPNVAHIALICDLIEGAFEYRSEGLLDNTHVRFFTRHSLVNLLHNSGLGIVSIDQIELDPRHTEFDFHPDSFPPKLFNLLASRADALTYQFIIEASFDTSIEDSQFADEQQHTQLPVSLCYATQLYWRKEHQDYANSRSVTTIGHIGEESQQLSLEIPVLDYACNALRLDIADRPGYVNIEDIKLCNTSGAVVWQWDGQANTLLSLGNRQNVEIANLSEDASRVVVLTSGEDSYFELPIPVHLLEELTNGGSLELTQSFPMSTDYMALAPRLLDISNRQTEEIDQMKQLIELRDSELAVRDATITAHQSSPTEREQLIIKQQHQIEEFKHLTELQAHQIQEREQLIHERDKWLAEKQDRAEKQYEKMQELEALMKKHNIDITRKTSNVEFREQSVDQQLQIRDDSIDKLGREIDDLQHQLEYHLSINFWLQRPLIYIRDRFFNKV